MVHWYAKPELQLMVYGEGIGNGIGICQLSRRLTEQAQPNWKAIITAGLSQTDKNVKPGKMPLTFTQGKKKFVKEYELKARQKGCEHKGFDASDALYLLMPTVSPNGNPGQRPNSRHGRIQDRTATTQMLVTGGDLAGIEQQPITFSDLGVTALWFTPVLENNMTGGSYHGYATTDYYKGRSPLRHQ